MNQKRILSSPLRQLISPNSSVTTFMNDDKLPSLPLPSLEQTMKKYLVWCKPILTPDELIQTEQVVKEFLQNDGPELQYLLQNRADTKGNWMEDWWLEHAYLTFRQPLIPYLNTGGPQTLNLSSWPPLEQHAIKYGAIFVYTLLEFFKCLRAERIAPQASVKGTKLSMNQFRWLFNTCRIPGKDVDSIYSSWKIAADGPCPQHLIILCHGHVWKMMPWDTNGESFRLSEIESQLKHIRVSSDEIGPGPGVAALTSGYRDQWAQNRSWLQSLSANNSRTLQDVEDAMFVMSLDDSSPASMSECASEALCGDTSNRWADKSFTGAVTRNGYVFSNTDHSPFDAMVLVVMLNFQRSLYEEIDMSQLRNAAVRPHLPQPQLQHFDLDPSLREAITFTKQQTREIGENLLSNFDVYKGFGKTWMKSQRVHPDAFVQMALQLAYYTEHRKMAPTYETATTRQFYHGRTETMRSCTQESKAFVEEMTNPFASPETRSRALRTACAAHDTLMRQCQQGQGIDRHLMGLYLTAVTAGRPVPELFTDPAFALTGGGGNYVLSTSTLGYTDTTGGAAPMVPHGYGCFYSMLPDSIYLFITSYRDGGTLSAERFSSVISKSLSFIRETLEAANSSTAKL